MPSTASSVKSPPLRRRVSQGERRVDAYRAAVGFYESNDFKRMKARGTEDPKAPTILLFFNLLRIETSAA